MSLDAKDKKIYDLLNDKQFIIPENQRKYVWEMNNWKELFDDILLIYKEQMSSHFVGSIVLKSIKINDGIKNHYIVIDGQQRISTITILFCVIAFIYAENGYIERYNGMKKFLLVMDDEFKPHAMISNEANPSINKLVEFLYGDFEGLVLNASTLSDYNSYLNSLKITKNVKECFSYFYSVIHKTIGQNINELTKIQNVIIEINYIDIVAKEDEDAYTIFEILNARGKPLSDYELLRNFILKYTNKDEKIKIKKDLSHLENLLGGNIDIFLKHYVTHKYGKKSDNKENRPYKILVTNEKENDKNELMADLICKAKYYDKIVNYNDCSADEKKIFMFFRQRRQQQFRPIIMGLMHQKEMSFMSEVEYLEAIKYLYAFFVCYNVIGEQTSNKIEDIVYGYSEKIENNYSNEVILNMKKSMGERIPSERHLKNSIRNIKYSNKVKAYSGNKKAENVRAIFEFIEREMGCTLDLPTDSINIEHCYPDSQDDGNELNFSLGNLMLLEKSLNDECQNKNLINKIDIYKRSLLKCPQNLVDNLKNCNFDIKERLNKIVEIIYLYIQRLSGIVK